MRARYIIATSLIIIAFIVHSISGELTDIKLLILTDIADNVKTEIRAVWYLVSIDFFASAVFLIMVQVKKTISENKLLIDFIGIRLFLYGLLFLFLILIGNSKLLFQVPQWILLMSIGILLEWGEIMKLLKK